MKNLDKEDRDEQAEVAQQAWTLYDRGISSVVRSDDRNIGRIVVIDVLSGAWEAADDVTRALLQLQARVLNPQWYALRVHSPTASLRGLVPESLY